MSTETPETMEAGRALDAAVAEEVMGEILNVPREWAMAMVGASYVRVTGPTFVLDVHGYDVKIDMPQGEALPDLEGDTTWNERYFRYAAAELLTYPNEIAALVERDIAACRLPPKPYSTNIAAAWQVVERLRSLGWDIGIEDFRSRTDGADCWRVDLHRDDNEAVEDAFAETVPLAICRAALAAVRNP